MNLPLLWRTLAPLRPQQLLWRPLRVAEKRLYRHLPVLTRRWTDESPVVPPPSARLDIFREALRADLPHLFPPRAAIETTMADGAAGRFTFLNQTITIGIPDWNRRYGSHLWNFQLHYFPFVPGWARYCHDDQDSSAATGFAPCQLLIEDWIEKARPGQSDGWDAYPVSLRIVNWIYGYALLAERYADQRFIARWGGAIHRQLDYLASHLEHHLLANHLFKNIKALIIGGLLFEHDEAGAGWLERGQRLFWREIEEQVLADGGHFERAPMYHAQTLADIVECAVLLRRCAQPLRPDINATIARMADFLAALSYRDGRLALFNDSANTSETRPQPILAAARRVAPSVKTVAPGLFPVTGYYVWETAAGDEKMIIDAGPPSVAYNTAHAHCDLLSFELQLAGRPWIVDTGVHGYGGDRFRHYCRSTRAHNTVMIDGHEQSEIWSTFRMGRMARIVEATAHGDDRHWEFRGTAAHHAHPHLRHRRRIRRESSGAWTIEDRITGGRFNLVETFLHLHPEVEVVPQPNGSYRLRNGEEERDLTPYGDLSVEIITANDEGPAGWYFPEFGVARPGRLIIGRFTGPPDTSFGFKLAATSQAFTNGL